MRISDWSSDVCSSELFGAHELAEHDAGIFFFEPLGFIMAEPFLHKQRRDAAPRHARHAFAASREHDIQIGRASCRDRVWQSVSISVGDVYITKKELITI